MIQRLRATASLVAAVIAVTRFAASAQLPKADGAEAKGLQHLAVMMSACPNGPRTAKQQAECKRIIDSIQASRAQRLGDARSAAALTVSRDLLMDNSFVADDDGRTVPAGRWVRIGSVADEEPHARAGLEINVGQARDHMVLVGALWTAMHRTASLALRIDCRHKEALVIKVASGSEINSESENGLGPWYPGSKPRTVAQAIVRRTCR